MTDELIEFVTARLDEWEAKAGRVEPDQAPTELRAMVTHAASTPFLVIDAALLLRLVERLRETVQRYVGLREYAARPYDAESTSVEGLAKRRGYLHALEVAIEGFAGIWSTHPDYRQRWKP